MDDMGINSYRHLKNSSEQKQMENGFEPVLGLSSLSAWLQIRASLDLNHEKVELTRMDKQ